VSLKDTNICGGRGSRAIVSLKDINICGGRGSIDAIYFKLNILII
jgi:hypothetical protein